MSALSRYQKDGLPHSLLYIHEILLKDFIEYFENGKDCRRGMKKVRKAVKKASKIAKKKKINPAEALGEAREGLEALHEEINLTRKALLAFSTNLESALDRIGQERIVEPLTMIETARELFRGKEIDKGLGMLKKSQEEFEKKTLIKSRTVLLGGTSNEVKDVIEQIEEYRKQNPLTK